MTWKLQSIALAFAILLVGVSEADSAGKRRSSSSHRSGDSYTVPRHLQPGRFNHHRGRSFEGRRVQHRDQPYIRRELKSRGQTDKNK